MTILRYLCFFPSITFGLISAEVFPYALSFALMNMRRVKIILFLFVSLLILSVLFGIWTTNQDSIFKDAVISTLAFLNPLLIFIVILRLPESTFLKFLNTSRNVFYIFLLLLLIQFSGMFGLLDPAFKALVPRSSAAQLGFRGVTLLSSEPARASIEFMFVYLIVRSFWVPRHFINFTDIAVAIVILVVFKSATGLFLYAIFLALFNRILLWLALPIALYFIVQNVSSSYGRALFLISSLYSMPFNDALFLLMNTSGNRVISIIAAIQYGLHFPFGGGIGNWRETSVEALLLTGYDYTKLNYFNVEWKEGTLYFRASGYMMNLMMDMGLFGVTAATMLIFKITKPFRKLSKNNKKIFLFFLINIFFVGSVGTPVAWIATAIILRNSKTAFGSAERCSKQEVVV